MMHVTEPDYEAVEGAELMLAVLVRSLPTYDVIRLRYWRAAGGINPSYVPQPANASYSVLWWHMGARYATDTLKRLLATVAVGRAYQCGQGPCPRCGHARATLHVYDGGAYTVAEHPGPDFGEVTGMGRGVANMLRQCYVGPEPRPTRYEPPPAPLPPETGDAKFLA